VGYNAAKIFLIFELKYFHENKIFSKMILIHESGAQEDQFDGKKRRPKISWYYPFNSYSLPRGNIMCTHLPTLSPHKTTLSLPTNMARKIVSWIMD
jgi:hypothetical protein